MRMESRTAGVIARAQDANRKNNRRGPVHCIYGVLAAVFLPWPLSVQRCLRKLQGLHLPSMRRQRVRIDQWRRLLFNIGGKGRKKRNRHWQWHARPVCHPLAVFRKKPCAFGAPSPRGRFSMAAQRARADDAGGSCFCVLHFLLGKARSQNANTKAAPANHVGQ